MKKILFVLLLACAFILRTYHVAKVPPALSWDEVSIGYNAYSILKTGRDEHGKFFPLDSFVAYGDYKPPLAIYVTVPFVAVFGLNDLAVRLPSALFGTLTVLLTYFLVLELLKRHRYALLSAAVLAISPWHVNLSRGGFEANIALFFVVLGTWLALSARTHPRRWLFAWLPFVAAIYTFNSSRVFSVLFVPALVVYTYRDIKKNLKPFIIGVIIAVLCMVPIAPHLLSPQARLRFNEVNIFTDASIVETANTRIQRENGSLIAKLVNNRRVGYTRNFLIHFMDNLQPDFLFVKGDGNPKFSIRDVGELYLIEAPLLAIGIFAMFFSYPGVALLLLYWIIAAIIPAATARETPHALRILNSLPTWHIFIAFGILSVYRYLSKGKILYSFLLVTLYIFSFTYYLHNYYRHYPIEFSGEWQYGYKQAIAAIAPIASNYDRIVITDSIGRPYMYTLFYTKTNPNDFAVMKKDYFDAAGFYHVDGFGKYRFGGMLPDKLDGKTLYIWNSVPVGATLINTVKLLNGNPVLYIFI
ncbi:MAG: glycosyltransferase family 39 protein [Candidatus Gottesmanbacteria bacterium]|nr:glycosyltransferase family 39 protein [Candidatus Gottesmanbacteria bacterium]